jgi:tight adherence protein B
VRPLRLISAGLAIAALALPVTAAAEVELRAVDSSSYPAIRAAVVTTKPSGAPPIVTENGQTVTGLQATNLARGKCVALAVDRSQSMKGKPLAEAVAAARGFIAAKPRSDRVAITSFATKPVFLSGCSAEGGEALEALETIAVDPKQGTTLYDDLVLAARQLSAEKGSGRVIIMVTDGNETRSKASLEDAIAAAQKAGIAVYVVAIESSKFNPEPLKEIATQTGGRYFGASSSTAIKGIYATIARELARTWRFEYLTSARPADEIQVKASVVGEGSAVQTLTIKEGDRLQPTPPSKLLPKDAYGPGGPLAVAGLVGFLVLLACLFFLAGIRGSWVRSRIAVHVGEGKKGSSKQNRREKRSEMLSSLFRATERAFGNLKQWRWVGVMLERADVPLRTVEFFWIVVGAGLGTAMIALLLGVSPILLIIVVVVAGSIPFAWVWLKMRKRLRAFEDQLPDLLITIAASLKAGHSFKQGLQAVVDEGHPPASEELRRVMTETSLGRPMDDALAEMAERMGSKNFEFAITAVTIQRQVGGSLATLFDMVADTVRQRQQFARKIRALTAMGRMSAYTLIGIPFFIAGVITLLNRSYMSPLYQTSTGQIMIVVALVMMALGSLFLKKIVSFRG